MVKTLMVSESLWIKVEIVPPDRDDNMFIIYDGTGGNAIVGREEIPALVEALQKVLDDKEFLWHGK